MKKLLFGLALLSCAGTAAAGVRGRAVAVIKDAEGKTVGTATIAKSEHGIRVKIKTLALSEGVHGLHIHTVGKCEAPKFTSAGPHWNPDGKQHGRENPNGSHSGDLPNLVVDAKRRGLLNFDIHQGDLFGDGGLLDGDGASIVIHAKADDYKTDPTGNSGDRIACGVIELR